MSHASPSAIAALSAAVSAASELYTTMIGVPLASANDACCSASARLLSTLAGSDLEASLLVTLCSAGPIAMTPAITIQTAMTIHGCLPRVLQVMMFRMCACPLPAMDGAATEPTSYPRLRPGGSRSLGSRLVANRVP